MRTFMLFFGMVVIALRSIWMLLSIVGWTLLPLTPVIGGVLWISGATFR